VYKCFKRFDSSYMGEKSVNAAATSYGVDSNWYADSRATDHITGELDKLAVRDTYNDNEQPCGSGMCITHVGNSIIRTPCHDLQLNNVLHVPKASKNLASIHRITSDNNVFFQLHPSFFLIKDRELRRTLLHDRSRGGLYHLP
jgi:hypothetical protein